MRHAATAFLIVGFMFGEMVPGLGQQPVAEAASLTAAANSVKAKPAKKTVTFGGYSVYLGSPRPDQDQDCPPDLVGRVDTISFGSVPSRS